MNRLLRTCCLFLLVLVATSPAWGQKVEQRIAEQKRTIETLEKRIAEEERRIADLKQGRASAEEKARSLARQIESRNDLLAAQERQVRLLSDEIERLDSAARSLGAQHEDHRAHYAEMVRESYRNYRHNNYLSYIFSARDFDDVARRIANLRAVSALRSEQMARIDSLGRCVSLRQQELAERRTSLDSVRRSLAAQKKRLQRDADLARKNIRSMSRREQESLKKKVEQERRLDAAVAELRKLVKGNKEGASFSSKTSNLHLPVAEGKVKRYKGNMAEINGPQGAAVRSIYEGKVADIKRNRITNKYDIYIAHGEYITSYANLSSATVSKGQRVGRDQSIGTVGTSVNPLTMETEYKIVFGIYPPTPDVKMNASDCFKK